MSVIESFDFGSFGSRSKWNWEVLTDGQVHVMVKGTDYNAKYPDAQVRVYAKAKGKVVKVTKRTKKGDEQGELAKALKKCEIGGEYIVVQFPAEKVARKSRKSSKASAAQQMTEQTPA